MKNILNYNQLFEKKKKKTAKETNKSKKKAVSTKLRKLNNDLEDLQNNDNLKGEKRTLKIRIKRKDIDIAKKEEQINGIRKERLELKDKLKKVKKK